MACSGGEVCLQCPDSPPSPSRGPDVREGGLASSHSLSCLNWLSVTFWEKKKRFMFTCCLHQISVFSLTQNTSQYPRVSEHPCQEAVSPSQLGFQTASSILLAKGVNDKPVMERCLLWEGSLWVHCDSSCHLLSVELGPSTVHIIFNPHHNPYVTDEETKAERN